MGESKPSTLVSIEKERVRKFFSFLLFVSIVLFTSCLDNSFIEKGKTYYFDDVIIINSVGTHYSHKGSAVFSNQNVKISAGKINDIFTIENVVYNNSSDEKVAVFMLSLNGDKCKAEFHQTDDDFIYLRVMKDDYQEENVILPCNNFIQMGKTYYFDSNTVTKGYNSYSYDEGYAVFSQNNLTINVGGVSKTYNIIKSSYYKNEDSPNYRADFILSFDGEECEAQFLMGEGSRILYIYFPSPSKDIQYMLSYLH